MCGIAGLIDPSGAPVDREVVVRMTEAVRPRGPDGHGYWFAPGVGLGHRRLRIIDLSDAASQPMANEDGDIQVVYNGEIYNFQALRDELAQLGHRFRSRTDTEVIVHGYEAWGDAVVERIDGMFAFALWDARNRRLLAARDRMGKKPFYYAVIPRPGGRPPLFAFGSELKALLPVPGIDRSVDPNAVSRYLTFEYVPSPYTIIKGAKKLGASERLRLEVGRGSVEPTIDSYWDLPFPPRHPPRDENEAVEELRTLLRRAVKRRLVSDVPLGVFLSGGIDSSSVVSYMCEEGARVKTFSIGFSDEAFDETMYARTIAREFSTEHYEQRMTPTSLSEILPEVTAFLDEPLGDASLIPTYLLSKFTREHVTVALGGDGGDELFAGYPTFKAERLVQSFYDGAPEAFRSLARTIMSHVPFGSASLGVDFRIGQFLRGADEVGPRRHQRWLACFLPADQERLLSPGFLEAMGVAGEGPLDDVDARAIRTPARDPADLAMDFYCRFYLQGDINVKVDRASSALGLEVRAPFLDTDVVRFACALPPNLRMKGLVSKYILRRAMKGRLPQEIIDRPKQGFGMPVAPWFKGELQPFLRDELHPDKLRREGFFNPREVTRIVDEHAEGKRDWRKQLWVLLIFERWLASFGRPN